MKRRIVKLRVPLTRQNLSVNVNFIKNKYLKKINLIYDISVNNQKKRKLFHVQTISFTTLLTRNQKNIRKKNNKNRNKGLRYMQMAYTIGYT